MNAMAVRGQPWSRRRGVGLIVGLFGVQLLLLWWFGARAPLQPRPSAPAPQFQLADAAATALLALTGPTLFAQGHPHGFSGASWMSALTPEYNPPEWSEPPRWLVFDAQRLALDFRRFVQTNPPAAFAFAAKPEAQLAVPETGRAIPMTATPSTLRVAGELAARPLLSRPALRGWEHPDLLTNSVVRVLVNDDGNVLSEVLLGSSGLKAADDEALALAGAAQFESLPRNRTGEASAPNLVWGALLFEWQTLPPTATNAPAANP